MILISVLIVLALEFYLMRGAEYRRFGWFKYLQRQLSDLFVEHSWFDEWAGIVCVLLLPLVIVGLILNIFSGGVFTLIFFIASTVILFLCLGPKPLASSFSHYFEALERGDREAAFISLSKESVLDEVTQGDQLVRNATRCILVESQSRYFGVLFWFTFLGPFGALFYRLTYVYFCMSIKEENEERVERLGVLIHWLDWAPARLTSLVFLLAGDFVNGFYRVKDYLFDFGADNRQLVSETGLAAMGLDMQSSNEDIAETMKRFVLLSEQSLFISWLSQP